MRVCVEMVDARDGCVVVVSHPLPPPARRVPVPVPVPGILEPGKLPSLCGLGMYREVLSVP